tara:strand:+ start:22054 stop:22539 length:486 start_codon:yes stop_codon:yes gene_type:complete
MQRIDTGVLTFVADQLREYSDDNQCFWDTLDGETDVMYVVGELLKEYQIANADINALNEVMKTFKERKDRFENKKDKIKQSLQKILYSTNQKNIPHSFGTISRKEGVKSLIVDNIDQLPDEFVKVEKAPIKNAIKEKLNQGHHVEGARLHNGDPTISIRMK